MARDKQRRVDHQLNFTESITRSQVQVIMDRFQRGADKHSNNSMMNMSVRLMMPGECRGALIFCKQNDDGSDGEDDQHEIILRRARSACMQQLESALTRRDGVRTCTYTGMCMTISTHSDGRCTASMELSMPCISVVLTPVNLKKIIATSLSQSLYHHLSAEQQTGFMSLDQTRRLLLIAEDDAKAGQVPLVGVWISGVDSVGEGYVWSAIVRYLSCEVRCMCVCVYCVCMCVCFGVHSYTHA